MERSTDQSTPRALARAHTWLLRAVIVLMLAATFAWYFRGDLMVDFARVWATCFNL